MNLHATPAWLCFFTLTFSLWLRISSNEKTPTLPTQQASWIIQLSEDTTTFQQELERENIQLQELRPLRSTTNLWLLKTRFSSTTRQDLKNHLASLPTVLHIMDNLPIADRSPQSYDPYFHRQWQYSNTGAFGHQDADIDLEDAWAITTGGTSALGDTIVVAVIDNAVNLQHPDLIGHWWKNNQEIPNNGISDDGDIYIDDVYGWNFNTNSHDVSEGGLGDVHGTPVCGIIGAVGGNGVGVSGVCQQVKLLPVIKGRDLASIIEAHEYILQLRQRYNESGGQEGAFIVAVNGSWGRDSMRATEAPYWCSLYDKMGEAGILFAAAAPNDHVDIDLIGDMPADCASDFILSVTNSNHYDEKVNAAGYGRDLVDIAAPGENSFTAINSGGYGYFGGCSAATPYVSGAIALLYALPSLDFAAAARAEPGATALLVKQMLMEQVDRRSDFVETTQSGGRLNVYQALLALGEHYAYQAPRLQDFEVLSVYPQPARGALTIHLELAELAGVSLEVYAADGRWLARREWGQVGAGAQRLYVEGGEWPTGLLLLRLRVGDQMQILKMININ